MDADNGLEPIVLKWTIDKPDEDAVCLRCEKGKKHGVGLVKITFTAQNDIMMLGPRGVNFCINCLNQSAEGGPPLRTTMWHAS